MKTLQTFIFLLLLICINSSVFAQSSEQEFPTPVTTNEIKALIEPRAVGDARTTTYYYNFDGSQGDIFVNVVTKNLNGDIDIFVRDGLRLLTKIVVYADVGDGETGRVIYLRKPEKLLLRVKGRTPNDDPASIQIKFAGSFVAAAAVDVPDAPRVSRRVLEEASTASRTTESTEQKTDETVNTDREAEKQVEAEKARAAERQRQATKQTETTSTAENRKPPQRASRDRVRQETSKKPEEVTKKPEQTRSSETTNRPPRADTGRERTETKPQVVITESEVIQKLVIEFKDGSRIERPMSEVLRFTVDRGVLTVIELSGRIGRYQMTAVKKLTIE